jgi:hypothetical protein
MTMSGQASPTVPGMIRRPSRRWCRGWSTTRWPCSRRSPTWSWTPSRPKRSRCWRWWPARTSSRASGRGPGGSPSGSPATGSSPTVDPQTRHTRKTSAHKRDHRHRTKTGLVTQCALTAATAPDGPTGVELLAGEQPGLEVLGDTHTAPGRPARRFAPPVIHRGSSRSHSRARCRAGSPSTTPHRPAGPHRQLPGRRHGHDHRVRAGQLRPLVPALPAAWALHHRQGGPHDPHPPPRGRAARRPAPRDHAQLPAQLSALAADGGTLDRLADRPPRWPLGAGLTRTGIAHCPD